MSAKERNQRNGGTDRGAFRAQKAHSSHCGGELYCHRRAVGSKAIAEQAGLTCSSATIRNELAALEKLVCWSQPHTSSGRIPTASGYRFYVNELMEQHKLSMQETQTINSQLHLKMQELDRGH